jgi:hypothetical protein
MRAETGPLSGSAGKAVAPSSKEGNLLHLTGNKAEIAMIP